MKARHFILNTALFLIIGCESKPPHTSDMIDLPDFKHTYTYEIGRQIDYALSEQGNDGREIRIWIIELVQPRKVIEIRDVEHQTYQRSIDYYFTTEAIHKYRLDSLNLVSLTANLKFDSLINELNRLGFDTMESQPDSVMETIADGTTYVIEIRTRDGYRMVRCVEPNHFNDANSRKWNDILKFLSSSVGFQYEDKDE